MLRAHMATFMRRLPRPFVFVLVLVTLAACSAGSGDVQGVWRQVNGNNPGAILTLNADGAGELRVKGKVNYQIKSWAVTGDYIAFDIYDESVRVNFVIEGGRLNLSRARIYEELNGEYQPEQ